MNFVQYVEDNISYSSYRDSIESLENELHRLGEELTDTRVRILTEKYGYTNIEIEDESILVPQGIGLEQLYNALQTIPPDTTPSHKLTYFVSAEHRESVRSESAYADVVAERQSVVEDIHAVYRAFWDESVKQHAETDREAVAYMKLGLEKRIRSDVLSRITDCSQTACKRVRLNEDGTGVVEGTSTNPAQTGQSG